MTNEEAIKQLENWADVMELDTERALFKDLVEELRLPVKLKKLSFDEETETFSLVLKSKIEGKSIVEIKECTMSDKRVLQKFKKNESIDTARAMISAYTNLSESEVRDLKDRDINRINAVVMGFINQVDPAKKD